MPYARGKAGRPQLKTRFRAEVFWRLLGDRKIEHVAESLGTSSSHIRYCCKVGRIRPQMLSRMAIILGFSADDVRELTAPEFVRDPGPGCDCIGACEQRPECSYRLVREV